MPKHFNPASSSTAAELPTIRDVKGQLEELQEFGSVGVGDRTQLLIILYTNPAA